MDKQNKKKGMGIKYSINDLLGDTPHIELDSNRKATVEGSRGVMLYSQDEIKISFGEYAVSFSGKKLDLRYISATSLIIEGFFKNIEFIM